MAVLRTGVVRFGAVVMAMALAGCSGGAAGGSGSGDASSPTAGAPSTIASGVELDPQMQEFLALDLAGQEAALAELSAKLERELWTETGMEAELGGPAATDKAFAALSAAMIEMASVYRDDPSFGRFGGAVRAADGMSLGGLMFGGWLVAGMGAQGVVQSTNDAKAGAKPQTNHQESSSGTFDFTGSIEKASIVSVIEETIDGVTGKLRVTVDIAPCPDANGDFTAKILMKASATSAGGRTGSNMSQQIDVTGRVGDDAELTGYDATTRSQAADFVASKGSYVDVTSTSTRAGGHITSLVQTVNRAGGAATATMAQEWANAGTMSEMLVSHYALEAAEKAWKSGRCVDLKATTTPSQRTGLKPSTAVSILAQPVSKIDGKPVGGTVTATLAGDASVDPAESPVPADATFAYIAPGEKDKKASVSLESRSKRGIGKTQVAFDTMAPKGYFIGPATGGRHTTTGLGIASVNDGSTMGTAIPADVCDITVPFTLSDPATGGKQVFTPTSATGGTTTYQLTTPMTGFQETGKGTYTLELIGDGGTIRTKVRGKLTIPGSGMAYKTTGIQIFDLQPSTTCS